MPKKPLTKKEKQMRAGALARQNMFLGGLTQSQIGDMVKQYQANQPPTVTKPPVTVNAPTTTTPPPATTTPPPNLGNVNVAGMDLSSLSNNSFIPNLSNLGSTPPPATTTPPPATTTPPPADTPPADTPPADTPPADTPPADLDAFGSTRMYTDMFGRTIGNKDRGQVDIGKTKDVMVDGVLMRNYFDYDGNFISSKPSETQPKKEDKDTAPRFEEVNRIQTATTIDIILQDMNPDSPTFGQQTVQSIPRTDTVNGGAGNDTLTGGQGTGIEGAYSDVINQMDQYAGLTGKAPTLAPGQTYNPQNMGVLSGELETTAGVQLGADPAAATKIAASGDLSATVPTATDANTVESTTNTQGNINSLALSAQQTNALSDSAEAQTGAVNANATITNETLAGIKPGADSIEIKKAELTKEPTNMTGATLSEAIPEANQVTTDYNVAINEAKGTVSAEQLATAQKLPESVAQAEAKVMSDLNAQAQMTAAQTSSDEFTRTQAQAQQQQMSEVPVEATVQGQLTNLMSQFADGKTPVYAAAAIRNAEAVMAQRGLSASSMAGAAIMQAAMESSIPVAAQDAQMFAQINLTNLNNKQQVALANAAAAQNIALANLNNRQQSALQNSTNAFTLQSTSLSHMQQATLANAQLKYALQDKELSFAQQSNLVNAARHAELNDINLSNEQQTRLTESAANLQVELSNLSNKQQTALANTQVEAAIRGQELTNAQQAKVINAARLAEQNNLTFTEEQTRNLNDAKIMENLTLTNLDADMKAALTNAATYASMDMANLNNRQQAEVLNAQAFLQLDMANLTNKQQGEVLKYQAKSQALFTDAAADNARKQFNAQSENQVDQFFSQLGATVRDQNLNRVAAMRQFNVNEQNAQARYNTSIVDARDKFNSTMQAQINQSNAAWRRQINTVNTANQNEANRQNALNLLNVSQNALNRVWQAYRDESSWLVQQSMSKEQYAHELIKLSLNGDVNERLFNSRVKADTWKSAGTALYNWFKDL